MIKRFISILLSVAMCLTAFVSVSAKTTMRDDDLFELVGLGIVDKSDDYKLDDAITRSEFVKIVLLLMNQHDINIFPNNTFSDVANDHWAVTYINTAVGLNLINGFGSNEFKPDQNISLNDAICVIVRALGYSQVADNQGGYMTGYSQVASQVGLLTRISEDNPSAITRATAFQLISNALEVSLLSFSYSNGTYVYKTDADVTFKNIIMNNRGEGLFYESGQITADEYSFLIAPNANISKGYIEIGQDVYRYDREADGDYVLGSNVDFYYYIDEETGDNVIIKMRTSEEVEVLTYSVSDLTYVDENTLDAYVGNGKSEDIDLDEFLTIAKNFRKISNGSIDDIKNVKTGTVTFIDNDDDNDYEVITIEEHQSYYVETVSEANQTMFFHPLFTYDSKNSLSLELDEEEIDRGHIVEIYNAEGEIVDFSSIIEGTSISMVVSPDEEVKKIYINDSIAEGVIQSVSDDGVTINGVLYPIEENTFYKDGFKESSSESFETYNNYRNYIGSSALACISVSGEVFFLDEVSKSAWTYSAIAKVINDTNNDSLILKMALAGTLSDEIIIDQEADEEDAEVKVLGAINSGIKMFPVAGKCVIDGTRCDGVEEITKKLSTVADSNYNSSRERRSYVRFKLNANGEISTIELPTKIGTGLTRSYNTKEKTFGGNNNVAFGINDDTKVVCIPNNTSASDSDYLVKIQMTVNGQEYDVEGFEINSVTKCAEFIVIHEDMTSTQAGTVTASKSELAFITAVNSVYSKDADQAVVQVSAIVDGKEKQYEVMADISNYNDIAKIKKYDLVYLNFNAIGKIDAYLSLTRDLGVESFSGYTSNSNFDSYAGYVNALEYTAVSSKLNKWVQEIYVSDVPGSSSVSMFEAGKTSPPPVFILDGEDASWGSFNDISIGDKIVIYYSDSTVVKAIAIVK